MSQRKNALYNLFMAAALAPSDVNWQHLSFPKSGPKQYGESLKKKRGKK